jgi:hypothetical protein
MQKVKIFSKTYTTLNGLLMKMSLTIEHDRTDVERLVVDHLTNVARLLFEFTKSACLRALVRIH